MVRTERPHIRTLAIGDGANDVNMISDAHVGVGIQGLEGSQAARVADFAIGEFKLLKRLILAHGRECYRRNSDLVSYFFYKNLVAVLPPLYIGIFTGFSGQILYEPFIFECYNTFFTALPILLYTVIDNEIPLRFMENEPRMYSIGPKRLNFNTSRLWGIWILKALLQALIICVLSCCLIEYNFVHSGKLHDFWANGMSIFTGVVIVTNMELYFLHNEHSLLVYVVIFGSIGFYFFVFLMFSFIKENPVYMLL